MKLLLASHNRGKIAEFSQILAPLGIEIIPQGNLNLPASPEPHHTFLENALEKARHASRLSGLPALADDSGLCVPALQGAPGVYSARYAGAHADDAANNALLLQRMAGQTQRQAYYVCLLVLVQHAQDPTPRVSEGRWHGEINHAAQGQGGFGYDPLFWLPEQQCTAAELAAHTKNQLSHRALALQGLLQQLRAEPLGAHTR